MSNAQELKQSMKIMVLGGALPMAPLYSMSPWTKLLWWQGWRPQMGPTRGPRTLASFPKG